jgi:hypothetical protein
MDIVRVKSAQRPKLSAVSSADFYLFSTPEAITDVKMTHQIEWLSAPAETYFTVSAECGKPE